MTSLCWAGKEPSCGCSSPGAGGAPRPFLGKPNAARAGGVSPLKVQHEASAVGLRNAWPLYQESQILPAVSKRGMMINSQCNIKRWYRNTPQRLSSSLAFSRETLASSCTGVRAPCPAWAFPTGISRGFVPSELHEGLSQRGSTLSPLPQGPAQRSRSHPAPLCTAGVSCVFACPRTTARLSSFQFLLVCTSYTVYNKVNQLHMVLLQSVIFFI